MQRASGTDGRRENRMEKGILVACVCVEQEEPPGESHRSVKAIGLGAVPQITIKTSMTDRDFGELAQAHAME